MKRFVKMCDMTESIIRGSVCGYKVMLGDPILTETIPYTTDLQSSIKSAVQETSMSMLFPDNALLATIIVSDNNAQFITWNDQHDSIILCYALKTHYCLSGDMQNSVIHALSYINKNDEVVLGVFDASKLNNEDLQSYDALTRHSKLHAVIHSQQQLENIVCHWVGYEKTCLNVRHNEGFPFLVSAVLRLPDSLQSGARLAVVDCE